MPFEQYFTIEEICQRLPRSPKFFRAEIQRGAFSPSVLPDGSPDLGNIQVIDGAYMVPLSGILHYLAAHSLPSIQAASALVCDRMRSAPIERPDFVGEGIAARSTGELRRKLTVQTSAQDSKGAINA